MRVLPRIGYRGMTSTSREGDVSAPMHDRTAPDVGLPHHLALIPRPQLVTRLREANGYPLVLITAPAGYAKSSLLAQWAEEDERRFALITLESSDDRPSHLLNRLVRTIDSVSSRGRPFVVGIDEADALRTKGALAALGNSIASLPPEGQIALVSRRELALPLGRMRAHRQVFELTRRELAMSRSRERSAAEGDRSSPHLRGDRGALRADGGLAGGALPGGALARRQGRHAGRCDPIRRRRPLRGRLHAGRVPRGHFGRPPQIPDADLDSRGPRRQDLRRRSRADGVGQGPA